MLSEVDKTKHHTTDYYVKICLSHIKFKAYDKAQKVLEEALKAYPNEPKFLKLEGENLLYQKKLNEAIHSFDLAIFFDSKFEDCYIQKGIAFYYLKQYQDALKSFNKCLELNPNSLEALHQKAKTYSKLKQHDEAILLFKECLKIKTVPSYYRGIGKVYLVQKNYTEASNFFTKAIALKPKKSKYYIGQACVLVHLKMVDKALKCFDEAIKYDPKNFEIYNVKGRTLNLVRKYEQAFECFVKALELSPAANPLVQIQLEKSVRESYSKITQNHYDLHIGSSLL